MDPENGPPSQAVLDALNSAIARAIQARKLATDFNGAGYFPPEFDSAEALYTQAESGKSTNTMSSTRESAARYNLAADAFTAVADKAITRYAEDLSAEVIAAREGAVNAGAAFLAEDYLLQADNTAADALAKYNARDFYNARDTGMTARDMYTALETGVDALKVRLEIDDNDFVRYDPAAIERADNEGLSAVADYEAGNIAGAKSKAGNVLSSYRQSLEKAWESYAADTGAAAAAERQKALDFKANVAVRQEYDAANAIYNRGVSSYRGRNFDNAANLYMESQAMFEIVTQTAREKRRIAEDALRQAALKVEESDEAAQDAELILGGGVQ
jgi:hypothetical protein